MEQFLDPQDRILELGCGTGYMITLPMLRRGYRVEGIDLDRPSIELGQSLLAAHGFPAMTLQVSELAELDGTYDAIIASEVLEHLDDEQLASVLQAIRSRLRRRGLLLVTVPNGYGWFELEAALWFRTGIDGLFHRRRINRWVSLMHHVLTGGYVDATWPSTIAHSPHRQRFTYTSIRRVLDTAGFDVECARGSVLLAGPFSHLLLTGIRPAMRINSALGRRLPWIAAGFYVTARRR
jgi:2-polyprenyl-3-methyl-5-hydroxy-6-metoxy-1,4-benzoquinol methylase